MYLFSLVSLAVAFATLPTTVLARPDESTATPNATITFRPVTLFPSIIYQENVAGQIEVTVTHSSYVTASSTTKGVAYETGTMPVAAWEVDTGSIAYNLPLLANYPLNEEAADGNTSPAIAYCWYPISGYYGRLARFLFYGTMFFAILAHRYEWLIMGALATGLTYSSVAALQAMVMVWTNEGLGNPDGLVILGLLAFSLACLVPLLNWSSTINRLGAEREEDSVGRSIIITWGLVLTVGFLSLFVGIFKPIDLANSVESYESMATVPRQFFWVAAAPNITCNPTDGVFNMAAGQDSRWRSLYVTDEFVDTNNCQDPCKDGISWPLESWRAIFRNPEDLKVLNLHQLNTFVALVADDPSVLSKEETTGVYLANGFILIGSPFMVLLIIQGIWAVIMGRRSPSEVRNQVYWLIVKFVPRKKDGPPGPRIWLHRVAKTTAIFVYLWTCFTSFLAVVLIVASMFMTEWYMHEIPQSDHNYQVDQWSCMVATAMVLLAAMIFQFQGILQDVLFRAANKFLLSVHNLVHRKPSRHCATSEDQAAKNQGKRTGGSNRALLAASFWGFWHNLKAEAPEGESKPKSWKQDWNDFWSDAPKVVKVHGSRGNTQVRTRRVAGEEHEQLIENWNKASGDEWLDIEEFIAACRKFDERSRMSGKVYKFRPRIIEETEGEERTRFNWKLLGDIFRPHDSRYTWSINSRTNTDLAALAAVETSRSRSWSSPDMNDGSYAGRQDDGDEIPLHQVAAPEHAMNPFAPRYQYSPLN